MKIAIDARMYHESGIGRYIRNLLAKLQKLDKDNEYFIFHLKDDYDSLVYHNNFNKILANFKWYGISEQYQLPKILSSVKPDLVHFPHFNAPIFYQEKFVVTIHDLIHQHFRMDRATTLNPLTYKLKQLGYNKVFKNAITKSVKIIVPSNYVKDLLARDWNVDENKVVVTPEAVDDIIFSTANIMVKEKIDRAMKKFNVKKPYIFYVGNAHPHKNVEGLIKAFLKMKMDSRFRGNDGKELSLVLSGHDHYFWQRVKKENQHEGIIYTGYVDDKELVALYKNALCFVMPSFEEGFGIPLLEAMVCSCPVVSSNAGALPEVGGDAAVYFDPKDRADMGNEIDRVLSDKSLRRKLIKRGRRRVKLFSWKRLAEQTLKVYQQIQ